MSTAKGFTLRVIGNTLKRESLESIEGVNNGIKCCCGVCWEKSEKRGKKEKGEKMKEERERQTRTRRGVGIPTCSHQCFHLG